MFDDVVVRSVGFGRSSVVAGSVACVVKSKFLDLALNLCALRKKFQHSRLVHAIARGGKELGGEISADSYRRGRCSWGGGAEVLPLVPATSLLSLWISTPAGVNGRESQF